MPSQVAIVTAAGYPGEAHKFEKRLEGLLQAFRDQKLPAEVTAKFHIMVSHGHIMVRQHSNPNQEIYWNQLIVITK